MTPTIHSFRAGADWREPDWTGPPFTVGDPHPGTWRETHTAGAGEPLSGGGEWISLARRGAQRVHGAWSATTCPPRGWRTTAGAGSAVVDFSRDVLSLGPFEEQAHVENPVDGPARVRIVRPGEPFALPAVFTGFGAGRGRRAVAVPPYLAEHRMLPYEHGVTFNSNGVDSNRISTGAKDDMDFATVQEIAPIARRMGVETFILDDGWQARSGDWQPDSPQYPGAALGRHARTRSSGRASRMRSSARCATRSRR